MNTLFIHIPIIGFVSTYMPAFCMGDVRNLRAVIYVGKGQKVSRSEDS